MALNFGQSGKGRNNPRRYNPKKLPHTTCQKLLLDPQYKIGDQTVKAGYNSTKVLSLASWIANKYSNRQEASQEMKLKSNESQLPKFYKVKQLKENLTQEFCWKDNFTGKSIKIKLKIKFHSWTQLKKQPFRRVKIK